MGGVGMARKVKPSLEMKNGYQVRNNIDEIRENFDYSKIVEYFRNGRLQRWLRDRYYEKEADKLDQIHYNDKKFKEKICAVFKVDSSKVDDDEQVLDEEIQKKLEYVKQYTVDDEVLSKIDSVATNQDELMKFIIQGKREIFLCGGTFDIPIEVENIKYIGIGDVEGNIKSDREVNFAKGNVEFVNIRLNDEYLKLCEEKRKDKQNKNGGIIDITDMAETMYVNAMKIKNKDSLKYLTLLKESIKYGSSRSMLEMGNYYEKTDKTMALNWFKEAAEAGETTGLIKMGNIYWHDNKLSKAKECFATAVNREDPYGMYWLGKYIKNVEGDKETARFWFKKAKDMGVVEASKEVFASSEVLAELLGIIIHGREKHGKVLWAKEGVDDNQINIPYGIIIKRLGTADLKNVQNSWIKNEIIGKNLDIIGYIYKPNFWDKSEYIIFTNRAIYTQNEKGDGGVVRYDEIEDVEILQDSTMIIPCGSKNKYEVPSVYKKWMKKLGKYSLRLFLLLAAKLEGDCKYKFTESEIAKLSMINIEELGGRCILDYLYEDSKIQCRLGMEAEEKGDVEKAMHYYKLAADAGNTDGMASIGLLYQYGTGVEKSYEFALEWYQKVIDAGDMDGWWLMGNIFNELNDYNKAIECYETAANFGNEEAKQELELIKKKGLMPS